MKKQYDARFEKLLNYVFADEGGFSDDPNDRGGRTNFGITQDSYDYYRDKRNIPRADVKNISKAEAKDVYYEDYYKRSGADNQRDIRDAYILFDTVVNFHPITAKTMFKQAGEDFYKMIEYRKNIHIQESKNLNQARYLQGWLNRVNRIKERGEQLFKQELYSSPYKKQITPMIDEAIKKYADIDKINDNDRLKNRYFYKLDKDRNLNYDVDYKTDIKNIIFANEDIAKLSSDEFSKVEHIINNQLEDNRFLSKREADAYVQSGELIWVDEYVKGDGTKVKGHYRRV